MIWTCNIAGVTRGKGQDLFLRSFYESLQIIQERKLQLPSIHAVVVGSDMSSHSKFETELRNLVTSKKIQNYVHFVNKTLTVAPYLAAVDVLVQNSQVCRHVANASSLFFLLFSLKYDNFTNAVITNYIYFCPSILTM